MEGLVTRGINNIYTVQAPGGARLCRIKGKVLETEEGEHSPLAVGDRVVFSPTGEGEGLISARLPRRSSFRRWNPKKASNQTLAANLDLVLAVCSVQSPPFSPGFIDRVIACGRGVPVLIGINKSDLSPSAYERERIALYRSLGYEVIRFSALTGENLGLLRSKVEGRTVVLVGQSGVGKSTLVNALVPTQSQRTGALCPRSNRGRHTTTATSLIDGGSFVLIDTPGVRDLAVCHDDKRSIAEAFVEFAAPAARCAYPDCLHDEEPGCEVKRLVEEGAIDRGRYESYLRMLWSLDEKIPVWMRAEKRDKEDVKKDG